MGCGCVNLGIGVLFEDCLSALVSLCLRLFDDPPPPEGLLFLHRVLPGAPLNSGPKALRKSVDKKSMCLKEIELLSLSQTQKEEAIAARDLAQKEAKEVCC